MEIPMDLSTIAPFNASRCVRLDCEQMQKLNDKKDAVFATHIDKICELSASAQNIKHALTSFKKLIESPGEVLYLLWDVDQSTNQCYLLGYLKCGRRDLYLYDSESQCKQRKPVCLLDFFVHQSVQHRGYGKLLYDAMLKGENIYPNMVAIDKPSENLLQFMVKHYHLSKPMWHSNNFVVYPGFFDSKDSLDAPAVVDGTRNGSHVVTASNLATFAVRPDSLVVEPKALVGAATVANGDRQPQHHATTIADIGSPEAHARGPLVEHADSIFAAERPSSVDADPPLSPTGANPSTLAKERKQMSMGHHKLW